MRKGNDVGPRIEQRRKKKKAKDVNEWNAMMFLLLLCAMIMEKKGEIAVNVSRRDGIGDGGRKKKEREKKERRAKESKGTGIWI
jgi:hypothetical protein